MICCVKLKSLHSSPVHQMRSSEQLAPVHHTLVTLTPWRCPKRGRGDVTQSGAFRLSAASLSSLPVKVNDIIGCDNDGLAWVRGRGWNGMGKYEKKADRKRRGRFLRTFFISTRWRASAAIWRRPPAPLIAPG